MSKVMKLIDYNNLDELRTGFINYLKTHHPDKARPDVRAGNALFIGRHNIGISLEEAITSSDGIQRAQKLLEEYWISEGTRKNPKGNASVYAHDLRLLKEYIYS